MCEFVEETPESYDVMTSGLNSEMKKGVLLFYQFKQYIPLKSRSLQIITDLMFFFWFTFKLTHIFMASGRTREL